MGKLHSFSAPQKNPVLAALDPSACYLIQFALEDGKFQVDLTYYDSSLELYCVICFIAPAGEENTEERKPEPEDRFFGEDGFERIESWIDAMLDSFFTEHVPLAVCGIPALDFAPGLRTRLLRHLTDRCYKNGLPLVILP